MSEEILEQSTEAAQINARFQENGISLEERVLALEEAVKILLQPYTSLDGAERFYTIQQ
ncbi:MAG: hypothetical protein ACOY3I_01370 [Verrucomicrobiota bacterium]